MCYPSEQTISSYEASKTDPEFIAASLKPGIYGTGKGTTAKIKGFFDARYADYSVKSIANVIGVDSRQLSKRLAELVKSGYLRRNVDSGQFENAANAKLAPAK